MRKHLQRKHNQNMDSGKSYQDKITKLMEMSYQNREYSSANFIEAKPNFGNQVQNGGAGGKAKG